MHPPLAGKKERCSEYIKALQECHARGMMHKVMGNCNGLKHELNMCLREERLERTARNAQTSAEMRKRKEAVWKEIDEGR